MITAEDRALIIGSLLHDIGKFRMRGIAERSDKDHSTIGAEWARKYLSRHLPEQVPNMIQWHHKKYWDYFHEYNDHLIIYQADNLAAQSEREEKDDAEFNPEAPLTAILSTISLGQKPSRHYWPLQALEENLVFPQKEPQGIASRERYQQLWQQFEKEFDQWCRNGCQINSLLWLLEKYLSFIPSETLWQENEEEQNPDISLFDHCKSTAAIALCLKRVLEDRFGQIAHHDDLEKYILDPTAEYFALIAGDLSGVQKFIYTISSRGALKTLRARSFFLEILCEHIINQFLQLAHLALVNVIYSGGGRFYLLVPHTPNIANIIAKLRNEINQWLIDQFNGTLALVLASQPFSGQDFKTEQITLIWQGVGEKLASEKEHKFAHCAEELFTPKEPMVIEGSCQICHRDDVRLHPLQEDPTISAICDFCDDLWHIGSHLPQTRYLVQTSSTSQALAQCELFDLTGQNADKLGLYDHWPNPAAERCVYALSAEELPHHPQIQLLRLSRYARRQKELQPVAQVPSRKGERIANPEEPAYRPSLPTEAMATFEELAAQATGRPFLAALRMDVDHLGKIFRSGIAANKRTFTRLASVSRSLSLFFKTYLDGLLAGNNLPEEMPLLDISEKNPKQYGRHLAVVYAGGDDLFLVGAWDDIAESAIDIQRAFHRFCGHNPNLTISGGFVFQHPSFPLYRLAELAEEAEREAKNQGRNRLTLFYDQELRQSQTAAKARSAPDLQPQHQSTLVQTMPWEQLAEWVLQPLSEFKKFGAIKNNDKGQRYFELHQLSHSDLGKLLLIMRTWEEKGIMYLPQMAYILSRAKKEFRQSPLAQKLMDPQQVAVLRNSLLWLILLSKAKD